MDENYSIMKSSPSRLYPFAKAKVLVDLVGDLSVGGKELATC